MKERQGLDVDFDPFNGTIQSVLSSQFSTTRELNHLVREVEDDTIKAVIYRVCDKGNLHLQ